MRLPGCIRRAYPIEGSTDRVVLFNWSTDPEPLKRNVARVFGDAVEVSMGEPSAHSQGTASVPSHLLDPHCAALQLGR